MKDSTVVCTQEKKKVVECSQYKITSEIEKFRNGSLEEELSKRLSN